MGKRISSLVEKIIFAKDIAKYSSRNGALSTGLLAGAAVLSKLPIVNCVPELIGAGLGTFAASIAEKNEDTNFVEIVVRDMLIAFSSYTLMDGLDLNPLADLAASGMLTFGLRTAADTFIANIGNGKRIAETVLSAGALFLATRLTNPEAQITLTQGLLTGCALVLPTFLAAAGYVRRIKPTG